MTRRLVALFLALLLPLQFAWGAAAAYCGHEVEIQAVEHVGHHDHVHKAEADQKTDKKQAGGKQLVDNDCGVCHASGSAMNMAPIAAFPTVALTRWVPAPTPAHPRSAPSDAPDRPQWLRLA